MLTAAAGQDKRRLALLQSMNAMGRVVLAENKYLEKNQLDAMVKEALIRVLLHRPNNPFEFLANHFEWENTKCNAAKKACQLLSTAEFRSTPSFEKNIQRAFVIASQSRVQENLKGITGDIYMDMMQMLTPGLTCREEHDLLENVYVPPKEVVSFRAFRAGLFCTKMYEELMRRIAALFSALEEEFGEEGPSGRVVQKVIEVIEEGVGPKWKAERVIASDFVDAASAIFWRRMMAHCFSDR